MPVKVICDFCEGEDVCRRSTETRQNFYLPSSWHIVKDPGEGFSTLCNNCNSKLYVALDKFNELERDAE